MIMQLAFAIAAIMLAGSTHFTLLGRARRYLIGTTFPTMVRFLLMLLVATIGQIIAAAVFALAFWLSQEAGLGSFKGTAQSNWIEIYYFSLVNLTTLGLGDVIPLGHLKFLAALEAMTGFLLISCSASHVFQIMKEEE